MPDSFKKLTTVLVRLFYLKFFQNIKIINMDI